MVLPDNIVIESSFLHLAVKDRAMMGEGILLGEAYLPLKNVVTHNLDARLEVRMPFLTKKLQKKDKVG